MSDLNLINSVESFLPEIVKCHHEVDVLKAENLSLREELDRVRNDNRKLLQQIDIKNASVSQLVSEISHANTEKMQFLQNMGQHFKVQADLVEAKYEVKLNLHVLESDFDFKASTQPDGDFAVKDSQFGARYRRAEV